MFICRGSFSLVHFGVENNHYNSLRNSIGLRTIISVYMTSNFQNGEFKTLLGI